VNAGLPASDSGSRLDHAMRLLLDGARLLAVQRNRYGRRPAGLELDAGAFVAALEYAAGGQSAGVTGVLVRTGKYRPSDESHPEIPPDAVVDSIADLPLYLAAGQSFIRSG
jgi:ribonucleotide monophosphatase NagD (HAD superfamily)